MALLSSPALVNQLITMAGVPTNVSETSWAGARIARAATPAKLAFAWVSKEAAAFKGTVRIKLINAERHGFNLCSLSHHCQCQLPVPRRALKTGCQVLTEFV
ncbi:hypothetical protein MN608_06232 [Microdochium nivale]|nr:hypothetical protein MN608_06232 [Microdochium nivale]